MDNKLFLVEVDCKIILDESAKSLKSSKITKIVLAKDENDANYKMRLYLPKMNCIITGIEISQALE